MKLREKWQDPPVHPANTGPKISQAELKELAADIKKYGLQEPIVYWQDNREAANGSEGPFPLYLLDGVNRLAALHLLGIKDPRSAPQGSVVAFTTRTLRAIKAVSYLGGKSGWETDTDPYALHLSLNAVRRHLTRAQKRWMIRQAIARKPEANDSEIARDTKSARKSVASDEFAQFLAVAASKLDVNIATVETWLRTYKLKTTLRLLMKGTAQ